MRDRSELHREMTRLAVALSLPTLNLSVRERARLQGALDMAAFATSAAAKAPTDATLNALLVETIDSVAAARIVQQAAHIVLQGEYVSAQCDAGEHNRCAHPSCTCRVGVHQVEHERAR